MNTTVYRGERTATGYKVTANGKPFTASQFNFARRFSEDFSWGYSGAGPYQLAYALLIDACGDLAVAAKWMKYYLWLGPACWGDVWQTTADEIREMVAGLERPDQSSPRFLTDAGTDEPAVVEGGVA